MGEAADDAWDSIAEIEAAAWALCKATGHEPDALEPGDLPRLDGYNRKGEPCHFLWRDFMNKAKVTLLAARRVSPQSDNEPTEVEIEAVKADQLWWQQVEEPLGLRLGGWTFRKRALFFDISTGAAIELPGSVAERVIAARRVSSAPSFAAGIESAASWHDDHVTEESGPDWGMASDDIRTAWRSKNLWHQNAAASLRALAHNPQASSGGATHRHKKRRTEYVLLFYGRMQAADWFDHGGSSRQGGYPGVGMREVAIYRSATDPTEIWVRPREEFEDGRFEVLK